MPYCPNCGEHVDEQARYCPECGTNLREHTESRQTDGWEESWGTDEPEQYRSDQPGSDWTREPDSHTSQRSSDRQIPRKDSFETMSQSFNWLLGFPLLIGAFLLVELVNSVAEFTNPLVGLVGLLLSLLVGGVAYIYVERLVFEGEFDDTVTAFQDAAERAIWRLGWLVVIFVIYSITVFVGLLLLILPGIYLGARLILAFPACVLDEADAFESLSLSWEAGDGNVLKLIGIFLLSIVALVGVSLGGAIVAGIAGGIELLESPLFPVLLAPVIALIAGVVEMSIARVYLENRPRRS